MTSSTEAMALWGLYFAIYHSDAADVVNLPPSVMKAFTAVQHATDREAIYVAEYTNPVAYVSTPPAPREESA